MSWNAGIVYYLLVRRRKQQEQRRPKAPAGWFYDPKKEANYRYWDGSRWTGETSATSRTDHPQISEPAPKPSIWRRLIRQT